MLKSNTYRLKLKARQDCNRQQADMGCSLIDLLFLSAKAWQFCLYTQHETRAITLTPSVDGWNHVKVTSPASNTAVSHIYRHGSQGRASSVHTNASEVDRNGKLVFSPPHPMLAQDAVTMMHNGHYSAPPITHHYNEANRHTNRA